MIYLDFINSERLSKMIYLTLHRFSKQVGIPKDQLDPEIVEILSGSSKNLRVAYDEIKKFRVLREMAKKQGKSFQDIVELLNS